MMTTTAERLTAAEAAEYLTMQEQTLAVWRSTGRYELPFVRVGRSIRYLKSDLDAFIQRRRTTCVARAGN